MEIMPQRFFPAAFLYFSVFKMHFADLIFIFYNLYDKIVMSEMG